jgi:Arc/MetJ-type ribon-helix-helix transcriptional regulator
MRRYECRIALRIGNEEKEKVDRLVLERKFKNSSQVIRAALREFLKENNHERILNSGKRE